MNDTPDWITRRNAKKKSDSAQSAEDDRQNAEAASLIAAQGPEIWQRFIKGLAMNANALSKLEGEELFGLPLVCRSGAFLKSFTVGVVVCIPS